MADFLRMAEHAAHAAGYEDDAQLPAFMDGAQWALRVCIAIEQAITPDKPSRQEVEAGARALAATDTRDWDQLTLDEQDGYLLQSAGMLHAVIETNKRKETE